MPLDVGALRVSRPVHWHSTLASTMIEASKLASAGAPSGTVVGADEQTAGQGRHGHSWHSEPETGLYFSVILRPKLPPETMPVVTLALGCATVEAIQITTGVGADLRWPNDVLIGNRKCAGILTQLQNGAVIAGIGINVNQSAFPSDIELIATSLRMASGREQSREAVLTALLDDVDRHMDILSLEGTTAILDLFARASSYVSNRRVTVDLPEGTVTGVTAGLTVDGFLKLRRDDGQEQIVVAGGVRPAES